LWIKIFGIHSKSKKTYLCKNPEIMNISPKINRLFKSRIMYVLLAFLVWMLFFDQNNWLRQISLSKELHDARQQEQYYKNEIASDSLRLHELTTSDESAEKLAREKYLMKKDDEEIFLIVREDDE
jgi:cell division protein FtsB